MKFLIKIEDAINQFIVNFYEKLKSLIPESIKETWSKILHTPESLKTIVSKQVPKLKIYKLKIIGYTEHYITLVRGSFVGILIYFRSDEFKNRDKVEMLIAPLRKFKTDPIKAFSFSMAVLFFTSTSILVVKNTAKIISGTKALRSPASMVEEEPIIEFKKMKYIIMQDKEIVFDITIMAKDLEERDKLIPIEQEIRELLQETQITIAALPPTKVEIETIEKLFISKIEGAKIKSVSIKQVLSSRPKYFLQTEKMSSFKDINLQLFLEDTRRNRQIWVDFTALSSNRNVTLYLKDHETEIRDFINMQVEPVIPQLPVEEEGRQIIKDKLKLELNEYLKKMEIEGKILEIYVDYIIVS